MHLSRVRRSVVSSLTACGLLLSLVLLLGACGSGVSARFQVRNMMTKVRLAQPVMKTFNGEGYSIGYPDDWNATKTGSSVTFSNDANMFLCFKTPNMAGSHLDAVSDIIIDGVLKELSAHPNLGLGPYEQLGEAKKLAFAGEIWREKTFATSIPGEGMTLTILAEQPDSEENDLYILMFLAPTALYEDSNGSYFQPILQSFRLDGKDGQQAA